MCLPLVVFSIQPLEAAQASAHAESCISWTCPEVDRIMTGFSYSLSPCFEKNCGRYWGRSEHEEWAAEGCSALRSSSCWVRSCSKADFSSQYLREHQACLKCPFSFVGWIFENLAGHPQIVHRRLSKLLGDWYSHFVRMVFSGAAELVWMYLMAQVSSKFPNMQAHEVSLYSKNG